MQTTIDWQRYGALGQIAEFSRSRKIEIACPYCGDELCINPTILHKGHPQVQCPDCKLTGYMIRERQQLVWFRGTSSRITKEPEKRGFTIGHLTESNKALSQSPENEPPR